jgi:hypothetical protein
LGSGVDSLVMSLAVDGSNVYVGGIFSSAGGVPNTLRIAKWDGSAWSALGTGAANQVNALLVVGTDLYAGGQFFSMGGVPGTQFIARWDGTSWSALGGGMGSTVHALAYRGGELYAGGGFTTAGGVAAARIAKWDGAAWSALGTGLDSTVSALVRDASGHLLVGGSFALAGATVSPFVAQANLFYLEGLDMTGGSLSPAFADTTLAYTASVPNAVSSITLLPTAAQGDATITVNGSPVASGAVSPPIALAVGSNTVTIVLTAADGVSTRTYTVDVTRAAPASNNANLAGLALSSGTLAPAFAPATTSYAASVPFSVSSITVTPTAAEANATIQVNGVPVASGNASAPIALGVGASGITTVVTAQDGTTTRIYTVIVTRAAPSSNAELSGLALSQGTLMPAFASATTAYAATVADAVASLTVTPTAADSGAIIRVNGTVVASGSASGAIALGFGANTLTVLVTAADGITARSYTIQVTRDAGAATVYNLVLEGWQQVSPYVLTAATGAGTATYYAASRQLSLNLAYSGLSSAETAAHIHGPAARGANAAALVTLSASNPKTDAIVLTSAQEAMLLAGQLYVNVHTSTHPNGEIRAQVDNLGAVVKRQLTVARAGSGSGRVSGTAEPGPVIDCGSDCVEMVPNGRVVALTATPAAGSTFAGWSGACTGSGACNVTLDAARTVTATFDVANPPRLANISTRVQVLTGDDVMIGGFIIGGSSTKTVLVRARGPSLSQAGVTGVLADPRLQLFSGPTVIASNDDWGQAANAAAILASGFAPSAAAESAILMNLAPGAYTAIVSGAANGTGVAIVEVFEVDEPGVPLLNISTRGRVQTGDNVMIGGFIIQGDGPQTVVVRARGPSLVQFAVPGVLANPQLTLFSGQTPIAGNDDWVDASNKAAIEASGFAPANSREAAILVTLQPGAYTAIVSGVGETTGVAIVEVFRN